MTSQHFIEWLLALNRQTLLKKVILVIDNCPAYPSCIKLIPIKLMSLPANTTSALQSCDQAIIQNPELLSSEVFETKEDFNILILDACNILDKALNFRPQIYLKISFIRKIFLKPFFGRNIERDIIDLTFEALELIQVPKSF